jgi:Tfp pilus assembly protein PilX
MRGRRGVALITALLVLSFVFVLSLSVVSVLERDWRFAGLQEERCRADYAARAGLMFYRIEREHIMTNGLTASRDISDATHHQSFTISVDPSSGDVTSTGYVKTARGRTLASQALVAPHGDLSHIQDHAL